MVGTSRMGKGHWLGAQSTWNASLASGSISGDLRCWLNRFIRRKDIDPIIKLRLLDIPQVEEYAWGLEFPRQDQKWRSPANEGGLSYFAELRGYLVIVDINLNQQSFPTVQWYQLFQKLVNNHNGCPGGCMKPQKQNNEMQQGGYMLLKISCLVKGCLVKADL